MINRQLSWICSLFNHGKVVNSWHIIGVADLNTGGSYPLKVVVGSHQMNPVYTNGVHTRWCIPKRLRSDLPDIYFFSSTLSDHNSPSDFLEIDLYLSDPGLFSIFRKIGNTHMNVSNNFDEPVFLTQFP